MTQKDFFDIALVHHLAGRLNDAEASYKEAIVQNPKYVFDKITKNLLHIKWKK